MQMGAKTKGTKKMGFKTMGAPKRNGSLTPKQTGTAEARPTARISLDFARKANMKQMTRVAPVPAKADDEGTWEEGRVRGLPARLPGKQ